MKLIINGDIKSIEAKENSLSLEDLIGLLGLNPRLIVVELNGIILTPDTWMLQGVQDGDSLEIVTIVGGGS